MWELNKIRMNKVFYQDSLQRFKTDLLTTLPSEPIIKAVFKLNWCLYNDKDPLSLVPIISILFSFKRKIASLIWFTLQIGTLKIAPDEDLIVSPFIEELPDFEIMIILTSKHSALLTIAPKFFVSVIPSRIKIKKDFLVFILASKSSIPNVDIGDIIATIPWWLFLVNRFSFSTGTKEIWIFFFVNFWFNII